MHNNDKTGIITNTPYSILGAIDIPNPERHSQIKSTRLFFIKSLLGLTSKYFNLSEKWEDLSNVSSQKRKM